MHKFAFFLLAQFIILFNGYAALPESPDSDNLSVSGITSVESAFAEYLGGERGFQTDPARLYGWEQRTGIGKADLTEEEEETSSSSKKQVKDLHPVQSFAFAQALHAPENHASGRSGSGTGVHFPCKRYILFEVFRI